MDRAERTDVVGKKYRLVREIGRGAVGIVYEAEHLWTERRVALKMLSPALAVDLNTRERFVREARNAARLVHPNVVSVLDADVDPSGALYIVEELLVGEDLETRLARLGRLDVLAVADVLVPVMSALESAHTVGIVHRDVKPSNVFLARDRSGTRPKLIDFGLSKPMEGDLRVTTHGMIVGTPLYMSPEQFFEPESLDGRTDVWSVAVVFYECLAGVLPYTGRNVVELATRVRLENAPPLHVVDPTIPVALSDAIMRGLTRDRDARWPTMGQFLDAIEAALRVMLEPRPAVELDPVDVDLDDLPGDEPPATERPPALTPAHGIARALRSIRPTRAGDDEDDPTLHTYGPAMRAALVHGVLALRIGTVPTAVVLEHPDVLEALTELAGIPVVVLRFATYEELLEALRRDEIDATWMSPVAFVRAEEEGLVRARAAIVRGSNSSYVSVLVTAGKRVRRLDVASLRGARAAWVDAWSAAGFLAPRRMLRQRGIEPAHVLEAQLALGSYDSVVDCLLAGNADLGAVYGWIDEQGRLRHHRDDEPGLMVLARSTAIPSDLLAFREGFPRAIEDPVVKGFLAATRENDVALPLLEAAGAERFVPVDRSAYDEIAAALRDDRGAAGASGVVELVATPEEDLERG